MYQHGVLRSIFHGKGAVGYLAQGPAEADNMNELSAVTPVVAMSDANTYNVNFGTKTFTNQAGAIAAKATDNDGWTSFWRICIGIKQDATTGGMSIALSMPDLLAQWVKNYGQIAEDTPPYQVSTPTLNQSTFVMKIPFHVTEGFEGLDLGLLGTIKNWDLCDDMGQPIPAGPAFNSFCLYLNLETNELHVYSCELATSGPGNYEDGPIHPLTTASPSTAAAVRHNLNELVDEIPSMPGTFETANISNPSANFHAPALPATHVLATNLFTTKDLSVADLQTTPAPSDSDLNQFSQQYMQNAGNYWRLQPEIDLFGNDQAAMKTALPASGSLTTLMDSTGRAWLGSYNRALTLQALQRDSTYSGNFTDPEVSKMSYYWQGGQSGCLSTDKEFNRISEVCAREAFLALTPGLKPYVEDSQDWANIFFAFVSSDAQLNDQTFAMSLDPGASNLTNRYCMILNALDTQSRQYDVKLWNLVRDKLLCSASNGTIKDTDNEAPEFLQEFMTQLILQVQTGGSGDLFAQLSIDLQDLEQQFGTSDAQELAARIFSDEFEIGQCLLEVLVDRKSIIAIRGKSQYPEFMTRWEQTIAEKCPKMGDFYIRCLRASGSLVGLSMDGFGLYMSIKYLQDWKNLDKPHKAEAVISMVQFVVRTGSDLGGVIQLMRGKDPNSFDFRIGCAKWNNATGEIGGHTVASETDSLIAGEKEVTPALDGARIEEISSETSGVAEGAIEKNLARVATADEAAESLSKTFSLTEAVAGVIAIAANVAAAVCMGYQIKADFQNGESPGIEAMDILSEIAMCLQVISGVAELGIMVIGVECIAIPIVGVIIAIVGLILMLCEMFIPHQAPPDPVKMYIDTNKASFISPLPSQPGVALTYSVTNKSGSLTLAKGRQSTIVLSISNPSSLDIKFRSIALSFAAGDGADELFVAPHRQDEKGASPALDLVQYSLLHQPSGWAVQGAPVANNTDGKMMAKLISTDNTNGSVIPPGGLQLEISGTVNSVAGTVSLRLVEGAVSRPGVTGIPCGDYFTTLSLVKS